MEAYLLDFANMLLRWLHVIAAIAWIGESIYFVMLDNSLRPPQAADDKRKGVFGEMWSVHGGGFYHNQKYATSPGKLPEDLHWSFWKAYVTWLSGFGLFILLYMANPSFYLIDTSSDWAWAANMAGWQANIVALLFLLAGWVVYNELCKRISPNMERDGILSIAVAVMMVVVAYLSTQIFAGRAAFLLTGAVMATAMSANVFFWIIPGQRRMVKAMRAGETPDPIDGKRGKQRSVHNTYFTLPVVLLMLSNHYSFTYSHPQAWIIMALFIFAGALIRQFFVVMHAGKIQVGYPIAGVALILLNVWIAAPSPGGAGEMTSTASAKTEAVEPIAFSDVEQIIVERCAGCHAAEPSFGGFASAPAGVRLDSAELIRKHMAEIQRVSVQTQYMPLGNITQMTEDERALIGTWVAQQSAE